MQEKFTYVYEGAVYHFEHCISSKWKAYTSAVSDKQALAILTFKAKDRFGFAKTAKLNLDSRYLQKIVKG